MTQFQTFLQSNKYYIYSEYKDFLRIALNEIDTVKKGKITYINIPCSFDIETTSFFRLNGKEKVAIMYEWTLGINGLCLIGRTWEEFINVIDEIVEMLELCDTYRLLLYVHNLSYEFQFMRKHFEWEKVFSIDNRKPIYAVTNSGIEFRCSYILSGYNLENLGKNLMKYKIEKKIGDLDYSLLRHSKTPLTDKELGYCINDVKVVMAYIQEKIEHDGNIAKIPLTKTGYVRNYVRNNCFYDGKKSHKKSFKRLKYRELISNLTLTVEEYKQLKRAFQGGFTHANVFEVGKIVNNVGSIDFTSSYPTVMIAEKFPMSKGEKVKISSKDDFLKNLKCYCCLFDIEIENLESTFLYENYLSLSRCWGVKKAVVNNGRIVQCEHLYATITEQDYFILRKCYKWKTFRVANFIRYKKGYLPTDFVKSILKLYVDKTRLKDVEGEEVNYLKSKEMVNAIYGMTVTDIVRDELTYIDDWGKQTPDFEEAINKYNSDNSRFMFFPWGVWVTAYARRNLFTGIFEFKEDYVYSDTDSIKGTNMHLHKEYIERYNRTITSMLEKALDFHGIDKENIRPKTINGKEKPLGVWDFEGIYTRFKTLGAKRYMIEKDGKINITVSGLNKKVCVPYLLNKYGDKVFENFNDSLYVPPEYTGKNTHTYIDECKEGYLTDYKGIKSYYKEITSVHLSPSDYSLSLSKEYSDYIANVQDVYL